MDNKSVDRKLAKAQLFRGSEYACLSNFQTRTFLCSSSRWTVSPVSSVCKNHGFITTQNNGR